MSAPIPTGDAPSKTGRGHAAAALHRVLRRLPTAPRDDAGDTLLEILFAVVILGIASVALLAAFAASISASATHRSIASFDTVIRSASQQAISQIQQQTNPLYESCAPLSYYQTGPGAVSFSLGAYSAQVTGIQYWSGNGFTTSQVQCVANSPQWITITITSPTGQHYTNNFVVDDPYAPPVPVGGPAYQLKFVEQPSGANAGVVFGTEPVVAVEDQNGNVVTSDLSPVTLTITTGTGTSGASLSQYCTGVENSGVVSFNGCSINLAGLNYQLTASDPGSGSGVLVPAISTSFNVYTQLTQPVITQLVPSPTQPGAVNVTFTGSTNAPAGESYTVTACANSGVGFGCVTQNNFTSGSDLTGLTPGTGYYVTVTANAPTPLYLPATSAAAGPAQATVQLNAPGTPTVAYGTAPGSIAVTFSTPTPASPTQTYTATACTNAAMTTGCVSGAVTPGGNLTGLSYSAGSPGTTYYVDVVAAASSGYLVSPASGVSAPQADVSQLNPPTGFSTASSATNPGAITLTFTASAGGQAPSSYTATICTNAAMTTGCTTQTVNPGTSQLTGLTQGTTYFVQVTANSPSAGFLTASTSVAAGVKATTQLAAPSGVSLGYGTVAGSVNVSFTAPGNAAPGQTYTAVACQNVGMTVGCVTNSSFSNGANLSGLAFTPGSGGTTYWVTVSANASTGYFTSSATSPTSQVDTSQLNAPGTPTAVSSTTTAGAIIVTYTTPSGTAPTSYTLTACTNSSMTTGCVTGAITPGGTFTGLAQGGSYWVTVTANPPAGYVGATSPVSTSATGASIQLNTPVITAVASSTTTAGQLTITYTGSSNAPGGQTYTATACTDAAMTLGCVIHTSYTSGSQFTGLTSGTNYYVTITAVGSGTYLAATSSTVGPTLATVQLATPTTPTLAYGTVAGSIAVTTTTSNGPAGQLYTVKACTNSAMTTGCVTTANVVSGGNATGLAFTQGSPGGNYYVNVTAQASAGYLASGVSGVAGPQADTSQLFPPGTPTVASSTTTAGAVTATFTGSSGPTVAGYFATACTNAAMTTGCVTQAGYTSGAQLTGLVPGTKYYVTITATSSNPAYGPATSGVPASSVQATVQLATPTITAVAPSTTTAGQITISFTGSSNAPAGQTYNATACTDAAMTQNCVSHAGYTSGSQFTGLTAGSNYYVTLTAVASSGYLAVTTSAVGPTMATVQLATPSTPTLAYGSAAGSIAVTTSTSNAPGGQLYSVKACTNSSMTTGCVTVANVASGTNAAGLAFTAGSAGTAYYVTATAQASSGYLASAASGVAGPQADTSQLATPTGFTTSSSATTVGAITATFTASSGAAPASYTATVCTNAAMTTGCTTVTGYTSGTSIGSLTPGAGYYVTITAVSGSAAFVSATTSVSGPTLATSQLAAPTNVTLAYGSVAGSIQVTYTASSNAAAGQTYTVKACIDAGMTIGCVTNANLASGGNLTGLAYVQGAAGTAYYVTVTANASTGYLASPPSATAGPQSATSKLGTPGTPTVASSTTVAVAV
jgi:type II secretory pathway pseudopilin PulG